MAETANTVSYVGFQRGPSSAFNLMTKDENTLYFISDTKELYLGSSRYSLRGEGFVQVIGEGDVVSSVTQNNDGQIVVKLGSGATGAVRTDILSVLQNAFKDSQSLTYTAPAEGEEFPSISLKLDPSGNVQLSETNDGLKASYNAAVKGVAEGDNILSLNSENGLLSTTLGLTYDSESKKIKLTGLRGAATPIAEIDATDFVKDGMIKTVELIETAPDGSTPGRCLRITWNTDAGIDQTDINLSDLIDAYKAADNGGLTLSDNAFSITNTLTADKSTEALAGTFASFDSETTITGAAVTYDEHGLITGKKDIKITLPGLSGGVGTTAETLVTNASISNDGVLTGGTVNLVKSKTDGSVVFNGEESADKQVPTVKAVFDALPKWSTFGQ